MSSVLPVKVAHQKKVRHFENSISAGMFKLSDWPKTPKAYEEFLKEWWTAIVSSSGNSLGIGGGGTLLTLLVANALHAKYASNKARVVDELIMPVIKYVQREVEARGDI
jgi:hypothetical protein